MSQRPIGPTESFRNHRRSMGDGTLDGRSRIATPRDPRQGGGLNRNVQPLPVGGAGRDAPIGETIAVVAGSQDIAEGGSALQFTGLHPVLLGAGFEAATFPLTTFVSPLTAYYRLDVKFRWETYTGPTAVWVKIRGAEAHRETTPYSDRFMGTFDCGVLLLGDTVEVWVAPS